MSDLSQTSAETSKEKTTTLSQGLKLAVEMGPIAIFMIVYNVAHRTVADQAIFIATAVFIATTLASIGFAWVRERRIPPMLAVTAVIVVIFGGLTLYLHDPVFIKIKPTIINCLWSFAIFGGLAVRRNIERLAERDAQSQEFRGPSRRAQPHHRRRQGQSCRPPHCLLSSSRCSSGCAVVKVEPD